MIVNKFSNGGGALFEVHFKHKDFEYPADMIFEAVISQGVVDKVIATFVSVNDTPQVSP